MLKKNLILILLFLVVVFLAVRFGLRWYTHHGEKLTLPNFTSQNIAKAEKTAHDQSFRLIVTDSIFKVNQDGGIILDQNPIENFEVKRGRKIYITITKYTPEKVKVSQIPELYGKEFDRKKRELENAFDIQSEIVGYEYDQGASNQILKVLYNNEVIINSDFRKDNMEIEKGGTLQFILSKNIGGSITMPDLTCKTYDEAAFYVENLNLYIGEVTKDGLLEDEQGAFIYDQEPQAGDNILTGDTIHLYLSSTKPFNCED